MKKSARFGKYLLAVGALAALVATPVLGSATSLANSPFGVKALNTDSSGKYAIRGLKLGTGSSTGPTAQPTPSPGGGSTSSPEPTTNPTAPTPTVDPNSLRTILTVDTSLATCTAKTLKLNLPSKDDTGTVNYAAPQATVDWGDGSSGQLVSGINSHLYSSTKSFKVVINGTISALTGGTSTSVSTVASCVSSIDQFGSNSGILTLSNLFKNSTVVKSVAAPPSSTTDLSGMFAGTRNFNGDISNWDTSNVTTMSNMFNGSRDFAGNLSSWKTGNVTSMYAMFTGTSAFNSPVNSWDVSKVTDMRYMFQYAYAFNQPVDQWKTQNVVGMLAMFQGASKMSYGMRFWNVDKVNSWQNFYAGTLLKSTQVPQKFV